MIRITNRGSFKNTLSTLERMQSGDAFKKLDKYGKIGVDALASATPVRSGETASSWSYRVIHEGSTHRIEWFNTNTNDGTQIAILIQYGHGTGTGGYVRGIDYINPAMKPIFEKAEADIWREVTNG